MVSSCLLLVFLLDLEHPPAWCLGGAGASEVVRDVNVLVDGVLQQAEEASACRRTPLERGGLLASGRPLEFFVNTTEEAGPRVRLQVRANRFLDCFR